MLDAKNITAEELVSGSPVPPVRKIRSPWPKDVEIVLPYPGAKTVRHPVDGGFIKVEEALAQGGKLAGNAPVWTPATATTPTTQPTATAQPQATAAPKSEPTAQATEKPPEQPGKMPDFSDLNGGPKSQAESPGQTPLDAMESHRTMGGMFHGAIEGLCCQIFGDSFKTNDTEKSELRERWAKALEWWQMKVLTAPEQLAAAYGCYFTARIGVIFGRLKSWMASRKSKRSVAPAPVPNEPAKQPGEAPAPEESENNGSVFDEGK